MKIQDEKTFNLVATTKKGNYPVEIKVWRELTSGQSFTKNLFWESSVTIEIEEQTFKAAYLPYMECIESFEVATHFNIEGKVKLKVTGIEVIKKYKKEIEAVEEKEWADFYEEENNKQMMRDL